MSVEENKAIVGRWFTEFWGSDFNPAVIDERRRSPQASRRDDGVKLARGRRRRRNRGR